MTFTFDPLAKVTPEEAALIEPLLRGDVRIRMPEPGQETKYVWHTDYVGDIDRVIATVPRVTEYIKMKGGDVGFTAWEMVRDQLYEILSRTRRVGDSDRALNERVNVHVPGLGLMLITEVEVRTDYCTENLQKDLENGWRILAVCPQPDQRRPDYILGRTGER